VMAHAYADMPRCQFESIVIYVIVRTLDLNVVGKHWGASDSKCVDNKDEMRTFGK
jgi:hypothetical protein